MPYQQMSNITTGYPLDRYLVDSSKKFEMVTIIDDELWNTDPTLKPEDELILRKLHEMLQSTANDLKLLSGELSKFHQPGVQIKTTPTPLDDEFNEKVHIEEIVNAKFHGYKIIDKSSTAREPEFKPRNDVTKEDIPTAKHKLKMCNTNQQINRPVLKKSTNRNLGITRIKHIQISGNPVGAKSQTLNNGKIINVPVAYKEYTYDYVQPQVQKELKQQEMPRINIRSELKTQKVLQLDIMPDLNEFNENNAITKNIAVISFQHEPIPAASSIVVESFQPTQQYSTVKPTVRKVSKMSTCESSGSTNNISTDTQNKLHLQKRLHTTYRTRATKNCTQSDRKKVNSKREQEKRSPFLDDWRKKLNFLYGSSTSKNSRPKPKSKIKTSPNKKVSQNVKPRVLNNAEYIPYSKLTIGGARASDIEKEISSIPNKHNMPLSPVLDKILSSRENSFSKNKVPKTTASVKVLTTSDENLLQEVIDIERTVSETLSKSQKYGVNEPKSPNVLSDNEEAKEDVSYVDDFEEEKSDHSGQSQNKRSNDRSSSDSYNDEENNYLADNNDADEQHIKNGQQQSCSRTANTPNLTRPKILNLAFKNKIDIFDYVHAIDTQETATQSNVTEKITPKETQTTPRSDNNIQPIHNDLWPSMDPNGRVEKMFELEKEFIKKLIIDEYGDILEKNINKPSSSKESDVTNNVAAFQKNTQTSPAHVKNVMTSPRRTKTRTTSPFTRLTVDHHTSPLIFVTKEDGMKVELEDEDLAISINLSSPRFSLRLPRNSQEVLSNLGDSLQRTDVKSRSAFRKSANSGVRNSVTDKRSGVETSKTNPNTTTSTSSIEADSSEISSLGEVRLRRMFANIKNNSDCESLCSTSSKYSSDLQSGILPLKSEGEMSVGFNKKSTRHNKSEGEASFGFL